MLSPQMGISKKTFLLIGFIFFILTIIGLVLCFATPWFETDTEGDSETYYYGDFGEDFEEDTSSDFDEYYHDSANLTLIGYGLFLIISILFVIEGLTGKILNSINWRLLRNSSEPESNASKSIFMLIMLLFSIIPIVLIIIGGTRFIGMTAMAQAGVDSYQGESTVDQSFSTLAGYSTAIIGFLIFIISLALIIKLLRQMIFANGLNTLKFEYSNKIGKLAVVILVLSFIGLVTIPVLSFMNLEFKMSFNYDEYNENIERTTYWNDGMIHIFAGGGEGDRFDDLIEDIDRDIAIIAWSFSLILIFSILSLFGLIFYNLDRFPKGSHLLMALGCFILIFVALTIISYILIGSAVGEIDKEFQEEMDNSDNEYVEIDNHAVMGWNYIPLIAGIIILIIGILYLRLAWPVSFLILMGKRSDMATPTTPVPGVPDAQGVSGIPGAPERPVPPPAQIPTKTIPRNVLAAIIVIIIIIIAGTAGAFMFLSGDDSKKKKDDKPIVPEDLAPTVRTIEESGYTEENQYSEVYFEIMETRVTWINCSLFWQDEGSSFFRGTNEPDEFSLALITPNGQVAAQSDFDSYGWIDITSQIDSNAENYENNNIGSWTIVIEAGDCGDDKSRFGMRTSSDSGNDWEVQVVITHLVPVDEVEEPEETMLQIGR